MTSEALNRIILIVLSVVLFSMVTNAKENPIMDNDTVRAVVVYGNDYLFDEIDSLSTEEIKAYRDSLLTMETPPLDKIKQIDLYLKIPTMEFNEVFHLVDSLFELEKIPYPLINQINLYIADFKENPEKEIIDTSLYPADFYYQSWNTNNPNPYKTKELIANDTVIHLPLVGGSKGEYIPPITGVITSKFGWRSGRNHNGIDIDLEVWDTVVTCFPGMVRVARFYGGYGRVVVVRHFNGLETLYAHLHRIKVVPGQIVKEGDLIGLGGSSGHSTGSHLHWEIRFKGVPLNPHNFIDFETNRLQEDTLQLKKTQYGYAAFPAGTVFHEVKKGDFLYKIAKEYGTTINNLCRLNGIRRNTLLYVGQKIRVI